MLLIEKLQQRREFGLRKYGTPLQAFNGRSALEDALGHEEEKMIISITGHSGMLRGCLKILGHRQWVCQTGGMVPVFVKVER